MPSSPAALPRTWGGRHSTFSVAVRALTKKAGKRTTPAMPAGTTTYPWSLTQITELRERSHSRLII